MRTAALLALASALAAGWWQAERRVDELAADYALERRARAHVSTRAARCDGLRSYLHHTLTDLTWAVRCHRFGECEGGDQPEPTLVLGVGPVGVSP